MSDRLGTKWSRGMAPSPVGLMKLTTPTISEELVTFGGWGQEADGKTPQLPPYLLTRRPPLLSRALGAVVVTAAVATMLALVRRR